MTAVLAFLRVIPWWLYAGAALLAWGGFQRHRATSAVNTLRVTEARAAAEHAKGLEAQIAETQRRITKQQEIINESESKAARASAAAASSNAAVQRLQQRLAAIKAGAGSTGPAAAGGSSTDGLAGALGECADRYAAVAAVADRAIIRGQTCERTYESLTGR